MPETTTISLTEKLQRLRADAGYPPFREISEATAGQIPISTVSAIITGRIARPAWHKLSAIVEALGGNPEEFRPYFTRFEPRAVPVATRGQETEPEHETAPVSDQRGGVTGRDTGAEMTAAVERLVQQLQSLTAAVESLTGAVAGTTGSPSSSPRV